MRKARGWWWRLIQDLWAINNIVIPWHSLFLTSIHYPHTYILPGSKLFIKITLCSVIFSIPVTRKTSMSLLSLGKEQQYTRMVMPLGYTESVYFSQTLKADLYDTKFSYSILLQYVDYLLLFCLPPTSSQETTSTRHQNFWPWGTWVAGSVG